MGGLIVKPEDLVQLLKTHTVYIQTHNFPDPDAIASAFGLQAFLDYYGVESTLCYYGKIDKLSTKRMLSTFGIDIYAKEELLSMTDQDYIVNVDSQKHNANLTDFIGDEVACIDHHPTFIEAGYQYKDIRITGACAALIGEYFKCKALKGIGSGGGHQAMAGGAVYSENMDKLEPDMHNSIRKRFLDAMGR